MHQPQGQGCLDSDPVADHHPEYHPGKRHMAPYPVSHHSHRRDRPHIVLQNQGMSMKRPVPYEDSGDLFMRIYEFLSIGDPVFRTEDIVFLERSPVSVLIFRCSDQYVLYVI